MLIHHLKDQFIRVLNTKVKHTQVRKITKLRGSPLVNLSQRNIQEIQHPSISRRAIPNRVNLIRINLVQEVRKVIHLKEVRMFRKDHIQRPAGQKARVILVHLEEALADQKAILQEVQVPAVDQAEQEVRVEAEAVLAGEDNENLKTFSYTIYCSYAA